MLCFDSVQIPLPLCEIVCLLRELLFGLMIQHDEISVEEIEAIKLVEGVFRVHNVFVDDECCAFGA